MVQNSIGKMPILIDNVAVKKFYYDYCAPLYYRNVDPITNVTFAGINNTSSVDVKSGHEFFLDVEGQVEPGKTYTDNFQGNTGSNNKNRFNVYIDWDQNGEILTEIMSSTLCLGILF